MLDTGAKPSTLQLARLLAALVTMSCLSQFYRVSNSVIAPELMRELGLSSEQLGYAGGAFFVTLLIAQIPVGIWFDRYGARITLTLLSVFSVGGAVLVSLAGTANDLIIARAVIGLGCAANFMALVFLLSRWVEPQRYTAVLATGFALSNIGTLAAATPLAWASATFGWRTTFQFLGALTAVGTLVFWTIVRDRPPGQAEPIVPASSLAQELRGLMTVFSTPGLVPVLAMHTFAYATQLTIIGVWAGPYLFDVHGLEGIARGNILLLLGAAQIIGVFSYGPLDRIFGSRKTVVIAGVCIVVVLLLAIAALQRPPLWLGVTLLVMITFAASYGVVIVSQGRALFPANLAGRGATTVNMAQLFGLMGLPIVTGIIIGAFPQSGGVAPEIAYRAAFAALAVGNLIGLALYWRATDSRP
jgi:predicted MFS family arabinose efflux permease